MDTKTLPTSELQIGDIVRLKSGSPDMKVVSKDGEKVTVEWTTHCELPAVCFHRI